MAITKVTSGLISADASSIDLNIDAGTLYLDVSENKVGIGTTSPSANLHVSGSGSQKIDVTDTGGVSTRLSVAGSNAFLGTTTNHDQLFITNDAERMRIDSSGNVGIGVSSVGRAPLHVHQATDNTDTNIHLTSNETGSTGSDGFTISVSGAGANDLDAYLIQRENANLRFYTNAIERMRIDSSGNLFLGKTSASNTTGGFTVAQSGEVQITRMGNGGQGIFINRQESNGDFILFRKANSTVGSVSVSGTTTSYNTSSDGRLKDVTGEARGLEVINELNPVAYNWKADGKADEGLIAQEVLDIVPNAVSGSEEDYYQMDYSKLVTPLIKAIQEQQTIINNLTTRIETLENA